MTRITDEKIITVALMLASDWLPLPVPGSDWLRRLMQEEWLGAPTHATVITT